MASLSCQSQLQARYWQLHSIDRSLEGHLRRDNLTDVNDLEAYTLLTSSVACHSILTLLHDNLRKQLEEHVLCRSLSDMSQLREIVFHCACGAAEVSMFSQALWQLKGFESIHVESLGRTGKHCMQVYTDVPHPGSAAEAAYYDVIQVLFALLSYLPKLS